MSRSNYSDDVDQWDLIRWRGQVASAIRGKRGQRLLLELVRALDAMDEKVLIAKRLVDEEGDHCALGVVGAQRGIYLESLDPDDPEEVAAAFDIARQLAAEIAFINDEAGHWKESPQQRWLRVRSWAMGQIHPVAL